MLSDGSVVMGSPGFFSELDLIFSVLREILVLAFCLSCSVCVVKPFETLCYDLYHASKFHSVLVTLTYF